MTNPVGPQTEDPSFAEQLAPVETRQAEATWRRAFQQSTTKSSTTGSLELTSDELSRLQVLEPGTRLEQGGTYVDLNRLSEGPFKALGGHEATDHERYIAKRDTDYELWNRLVGEDGDPEIERP